VQRIRCDDDVSKLLRHTLVAGRRGRRGRSWRIGRR
jgi:hypothetical protein